jgi:hypothetical protein
MAENLLVPPTGNEALVGLNSTWMTLGGFSVMTTTAVSATPLDTVAETE